MKDCWVEVELSIGANKYKICRAVKKYGVTPFEIYKNGKLINQDAKGRDYQAYLEKNIVKMNFRSFTQIVILGSASFVPFMQLKGPERRGIIEDLLDIKIFSSMNTILKLRADKNKQALYDVNKDITLHRERIRLQKQYVDSLHENNQKKIDLNLKQIEATTNQIAQHQQVINDLEASITEAESDIADNEKFIAKKTNVEKYESQLEERIRTLNKEIKFYENNDVCPTCTQPLDNDFKQTKLAKKKEKVDFALKGLQKLEDEFTKVNTRLNEIIAIQNTIIKARQEQSINKNSIASLKQYITKVEHENQELAQDRKDVLKEEKNLKKLVAAGVELDRQKEALIHEKDLLEQAGELLNDKGIKTRIVKQYVPIINKLINKYLQSMDSFFAFELDENFEETIRSRYRDDFSYESFSEGEKQRIDLALLFTWRAIAKMKNSTSTNLLILDETFDASLDANGAEEVMKLLSQMGSDTNVFVISHKKDLLSDKFHSTIQFKKKKNFSVIA